MGRTRLIAALVAVLALAMLLAGCGGGDRGAGGEPSDGGSGAIKHNSDNARTSLTIGSKNFTEQQVLGQIYAQGLRAAGYTVKTALNLGDENIAHAAIKRGAIDAYPEYTGTALLSFFGKKASQLPRDPEQAYEEARQAFAAENLVALSPTLFTSSNEVAVTNATADRLGLSTISDLTGKARDLTLYGSPECKRRLDCLAGLEQVYGLHFKRFVPVPIARRHAVLTSGRADVSIVFTTDPQIKRNGEVLLEDDKGMFPPQNSTLVVRKDIADTAGPDLARSVELINGQLTDETMQELNARVDLDHEDPAKVARDYLRQAGLVDASTG
jgi:osmoprotectant transport system substrate-binding protein